MGCGKSGLTTQRTERQPQEKLRDFKLRRMQMKGILKRLWKEEEGQDLTEYALLVVLIALAAITAMNTLAGAITNIFNNAASNLTTTVGT
jgi:pilus assembly protein Flp/PilA